MASKEGINSTAVRQLLKRWNKTEQLGRHPLASLMIVADTRTRLGYGESTIGSGLAMRHLLNEALHSLQPNAQEEDPTDLAWRPYLIIRERYASGRPIEWIAQHLHIAPRTIYKALEIGIQGITDRFIFWENKAVQTNSQQRGHSLPQTLTAPPLPTHTLVGREQTVSELHHTLINPPSRLAIHGLPGVGKTTIAIQMAHHPDIEAHFSDGIIWLGLGPRPDLDALLGEVAQRVGVSDHSFQKLLTPAAKAQHVHQHIRKQKILFIIDDAWEIESALGVCVGGPQACHLVTTRSLDLALDFAETDARQLEELSPAESAQLMEALVPELEHPAALWPKIGGLPLALVVIGKYLHKIAFRGQKARLQEALEQLERPEQRLSISLPQTFLEQEKHPGLHKKQKISIGEVIGLSCEELSPEEKLVLHALTTFPPKPNTFSREVALHLSDRSTGLDKLIDCGLIEPHTEDRYTIHQLIHDYAAHLLPESGKTGRIIDYFAAFGETHRDHYSQIERDQINIQTALHLAENQGDAHSFSRILFGYLPLLIDRGRSGEAEKWHHVAQSLPADQKSLTQAYRWINQALMQMDDDVEAAVNLLRQAADLAAELGASALTVTAQMKAVDGLLIQSNLPEASILLTTALNRARQLRDVPLQARLHTRLATTALHKGQYDEAIHHGLAAQKMYEQQKDTRSLGQSLLILGVVHAERGEFDQAMASYEPALKHFRAVGHRVGEGHLLNNMGNVAYNVGRWDDARTYHQQALAIRREVQNIVGVIQSYSSLAVVALLQKDVWQAQTYFEQAFPLARERQQWLRLTRLLANRAWMHRQMGVYEAAAADAREMLHLSQQINSPQMVGEAHYQLGLAFLGQRSLDLAADHLDKALDQWRQQERETLIMETTAYLAWIRFLDGDQAAARLLLQESEVGQTVNHSLDGYEDPVAVLAICHQILGPAAHSFLEAAETYIHQQSQQLQDPIVRRHFIEHSLSILQNPLPSGA